MRVQIVDGFRLVNIDVPRPTARPAVALLTAIMVTASLTMDAASVVLEDFISYVTRSTAALRLMIDNLFRRTRRDLTPAWTESNSPPQQRMQSDGDPFPMEDTEAQVIFPDLGEAIRRPGSFVTLFDCRNHHNRAEYQVINLATGSDYQIIQAIRLLEDLRSRSLTGSFRKLFSISTTTLESALMMHPLLGGVATYNPQASRNLWVGPESFRYEALPPLSSHWLQHLFHFPRHLSYRPESTWITDTLTKRAVPLSNAELFDGSEKEPIYGLALRTRYDPLRIMTFLSTSTITLSLFTFIWSMIDLRKARVELKEAEYRLKTVHNLARAVRIYASSRSCPASEDYFSMSKSCPAPDLYLPPGTASAVDNTWFELKPVILPVIAVVVLMCITIVLTPIIRNSIMPIIRALVHVPQKLLKAGTYRIKFYCTCSRQLEIERAISVADLKMAWDIYKSVAQMNGLSTAPDSLPRSYSGSDGNVQISNQSQTQQDATRAEKQSLSSKFEGKTIEHDAEKAPANPGDDETQIDNSQVNDGTEGKKVKKYLIVCFPGPDGRRMDHIRILKDIADQDLIQQVQREYNSYASRWRGVGRLTGFSAIRLARFELAHTPVRRIPADIEWKWPTKNDKEWEHANDEHESLSIDGIRKVMMCLWTSGRHKKAVKPKPIPKRKQRLRRIEISWRNRNTELPIDESSVSTKSSPLLRLATLIRIRFPKDEAVVTEVLERPELAEDAEIEWLRSASLEIDFGHNLVHPRFILQRVPKKLNEPFDIDPSGLKAPIGWAIWIDEDFSVPWYLPLIFLLISIGLFIFAVVYTADHGPKANGWTVGSFLLTPISVVFTAWVLRAKDSKHARI